VRDIVGPCTGTVIDGSEESDKGGMSRSKRVLVNEETLMSGETKFKLTGRGGSTERQ